MIPKRAAAAFIVLASVATACPARAGEVVIGVVGPLSGPSSFVGVEQQRGAQVAAEDINNAGGIRGKRVRLEIRDDADRSRLLGIVRDLVRRSHAAAIVGPEIATPVLGPSSIAARAGVPVLLPYAPLADLTGTRGVFRLRPGAQAQAQAITRWLTDERKIAKIVATVPAGQGETVGKVLGVTSFEHQPGEIDQTRLARQMRATGARALVVWGAPEDAARIVQAVGRIGWHPQIAGSEDLFFAAYRSLAGQASDDTAFPLPFRRDWFSAPVVQFLVKLLQKFGVEPIPKQRTLVPELPLVAMASYDAVMMVAHTAQKTGWSPRAITGGLERLTDEHGVGGIYSFTRVKHDAFTAADEWAARFYNFAFLYDADSRADRLEQIRFYRVQASALAVPREALAAGKGAELQQRILEDILTNPEKVEFFKPYRPPRPPPGPL